MESNINVPITTVKIERVNLSYWNDGDNPRQTCLEATCALLSPNGKKVGQYKFSNEGSFHDNKIEFPKKAIQAIEEFERSLEEIGVSAVLEEFKMIEAHNSDDLS